MMKKALRNKIESQFYTRTLTLHRAEADLEAMTVPASLSSETPVQRFFGSEVLIHNKSAINMDHVDPDNGLPLLFNHDDSILVGRIKNIILKGKKLRGVLHFSPNSERAREIWADVQDKFLTAISIRYSIDEIRETLKPGAPDLVEVTRWTILEASICTVPADPTVGILRSHEQEAKIMDPVTEPAANDAGKPLTVATFTAGQKRAQLEGAAIGTMTERNRVSDITRLFDLHIARKGVADLRTQCISGDTTAARAAEMLLEYLSGEVSPVQIPNRQDEGSHGQRVEIGEEEAEKWIRGMQESIESRAGMIKDKEARIKARQSEFTGMSLSEIARTYLVRQRVNMSGMSRQGIAGQAFVRAGMHGTSDFAAVLENVANKSMLTGYDEAPETWQSWCRKGSLADFKVASRVNISSFSDLEQVLENAEYKEGHLSDLKETIQLAKYGKTFTIGREAIINDDLDAFTRIPNAMGRAGARTVGDIAYLVLTSNPTLVQDATALFAAGHANLGTGGVITETTLDEFGRLMAVQTSPAPGTGETGAVLNIAPKFLIVPRGILMAAAKTVRTVTAPDTAGSLAVNTQFNQWEIISDARLDADSAVQYYAAADPMQADTVEVAFLDGNEQPFMESQNGFTQDGVKYKVRVEAAAAALDFRGLARNAGA